MLSGTSFAQEIHRLRSPIAVEIGGVGPPCFFKLVAQNLSGPKLRCSLLEIASVKNSSLNLDQIANRRAGRKALGAGWFNSNYSFPKLPSNVWVQRIEVNDVYS